MALRFILLTLVTALLGNTLAQGLPRAVRTQIIEAIVQIIPWDPDAGELAPWSGSGTIISDDGYVLTNYHVIGDLDTRQYFQDHAIFMTRATATDEAPAMRYWARYVAADPTHDLALLKIYQYPDESPVPADLTFPSVAVGDSSDLLPGDTITIVGYPGISGSTITFTAGLMSGWVGEDFEASGKQWIKTDAKIAHGNSGGGAFDEGGRLIGVPTAGRTLQYAELDVEEQAYVRPVSLAWALIGPNVPTVRRAAPDQASAQGTPAVTVQTPPTAPLTPTPPTPTPPAPAAGRPQPSGEYGVVPLGGSVSGVLAAPAGEDRLVFHTYTVEIPAGAGAFTVQLTGDGADLDLALKSGSPIASYEDVDHLDTSEEPNPTYTYATPPAGTLYIDVLNLLAAPAAYTLSVTAGAGTGGAAPPATPANPLGPLGPLARPPLPAAPATLPPVNPPAVTPPSATLPSVTAPSPDSGTVGALQLGQSATGRLAGVANQAAYHTYFVDVPAGASTLTITMEADRDLDLAAKFDSEIGSYRSQAEGGDWTHFDSSENAGATFVIEAPEAGRWYIDVVNFLGDGATGAYTLSVR